MGKRQESRDRIERRIVELGRHQLISEGAAGLSLRAIARELGMVSSAVYRYVASRDELLTLLLVDAYTELADAVERARPETGTWREHLTAIGRAARRWALSQPASWALLYGSPVPGYHAPRDRTVGPGTRVVGMVFAAVSLGIADGDIPDPKGFVAPHFSRDLAALRSEYDLPAGDVAATRCLTVWATLIGAISLEVFGQYGADTFSDPAEVFDTQMALIADFLAQN